MPKSFGFQSNLSVRARGSETRLHVELTQLGVPSRQEARGFASRAVPAVSRSVWGSISGTALKGNPGVCWGPPCLCQDLLREPQAAKGKTVFFPRSQGLERVPNRDLWAEGQLRGPGVETPEYLKNSIV